MSKQQQHNQTWFYPVLFLIFLTLKLTGYITWSWLWVTAPLWMPVVIMIAVIIMGLLLILGNEILGKVRKQIEAGK